MSTNFSDLKYKTEDGRVLPIILASPTTSTQTSVNVYMLRLTPMGAYNEADIKAFINPYPWICAKEQSKQDVEHYHVVVFCSESEDWFRDQVRAFLVKFFPQKAKCGDSNKRYNLQTAATIKKAIEYTIKDGELTYSDHINPEYIKAAYTRSFKKFDKKTFATELNKLKEDFKTKTMGLDQFMVKFIQLKAAYTQPINMTYAYQLAMSVYINKYPDNAEQEVSNYLDRLRRYS